MKISENYLHNILHGILMILFLFPLGLFAAGVTVSQITGTTYTYGGTTYGMPNEWNSSNKATIQYSASTSSEPTTDNEHSIEKEYNWTCSGTTLSGANTATCIATITEDIGNWNNDTYTIKCTVSWYKVAKNGGTKTFLTSASDSKQFITPPITVASISGEGKTSTVSDVNNITESQTIYVAFGTSLTLTATAAPLGATFPSNKPTWSGISSTYLSATSGTSITISDTTPSGEYTISAACNNIKVIKVYVVEIVKPAKHGDASKWLASDMKYDCQVLKLPSSVHLQPALPIVGNWGGSTSGEWSAAPGVFGDKNSSSTFFRHYLPSKGITLGLYFSAMGNTPVDTRTIDVFEDYLELGHYNFGTGRTCDTGWKPLGHYGVAESNISGFSTWNCHGGTNYLISGDTTGSAASPNLSSHSEIHSTVQATQGASVTLPSLERGDIIVYYQQNGNYMHSQVVLSQTSTYSANNEQMPAPGWVTDQSWKWGESAPGEWASNVANNLGVRPITIKVFRKTN